MWIEKITAFPEKPHTNQPNTQREAQIQNDNNDISKSNNNKNKKPHTNQPNTHRDAQIQNDNNNISKRNNNNNKKPHHTNQTPNTHRGTNPKW